MIKIYDDTFNLNAPPHRNHSMGRVENDIMSDLKKYSVQFDCMFTSSLNNADIAITNSSFSDEVLNSAIIKVKRMDGIYWREDEVGRNEQLNIAAVNADLVIFISEFSKRSFHTLYPELKLKSECVVLNNVDNNVFYPIEREKNKDFIWVASCSNWIREEKRFYEIIKFAKFIQNWNEKIYLIGKCDFNILSNMIKIGYVENYQKMNSILNLADGFVNFSYRDAGCKCVCQAVNCGLPVLYANSGGLPELVKDFGVAVEDEKEIFFSTKSPELSDFTKSYEEYKGMNFVRPEKNYLEYTIGKYFEEIYKCGSSVR